MLDQQYQIEVCYAEPAQQYILTLAVNPGTTVQEAILKSGLLIKCQQLDLSNQPVGIFGTVVALDHLVADGDRIEIYRNLCLDPKIARLSKAKWQNLKNRY